MKIYAGNDTYKLYQGSMLDMLEVIQPASVDSIVTDPPYELGFMNKSWDNSGIAFQKETWEKCLKVLKPGGYLLAFGGSRTFHRIAVAIEDAGFEIRDTIMWLYGSGFPKSMNIGLAIDKKLGVDNRTGVIRTDGVGSNSASGCYNLNSADAEPIKTVYEERIARNEWNGWGTALKPAYEPIIVARKPCENSCIDNVLKYGVGGINIDECRIGDDEIKTNGGNKFPAIYGDFNECEESSHNGRFPSNVILTYDETDQEEVIGGMPFTASNGGEPTMPDFKDAGQKNSYNKIGFNDGESAERIKSRYTAPSDSGSAARYFYTAKASKKDRDDGLTGFDTKGAKELLGREDNSDGASWNGKYSSGNAFAGCGAPKKNTHPTVKPTDLMQYLVRLVSPKGSTILDVFNGSGSTGKAVMFENRERQANYKYIGIELTEEYLPISKARIEFAINYVEPAEVVQQIEGQLSLEDILGSSAI